MTAERVALEVDGGVAVLTLGGDTALNLYDLVMRDALIDAFAAVAAHPDARAVLLRAEGRHFSAGADLSEFGTAASVLEARRIRWDRDPWTPLWELPQPTVACLKGHALGAGLEMALLCDLRLAAPDTRLGLPETKLGMLPSAGGTQSLLRVAGPARTLALVLAATTITAEEAVELGVVQRVCDDVDAAGRETAARLAAMPAAALRAARRALRAAADLPLPLGLDAERALAARVDQPSGASAAHVAAIDAQGSSPTG